MQVNHASAPVPLQNRFPWILSLILLTIVVLWSLSLGLYNLYLDRQIVNIRIATAEMDRKIDTLSQSKEIIITKILRSNILRPSLDINGLIKEFQRVALASNVRLTGFNVAGDTLSTTLTATEWDPQIHPDPASTIIKMMREYARGQQYFALEPISSIAWDAKTRTTSIQFKVVGKKY